jgi:membrane fusion protein, macrolide-specific efflux system
MTPQPKKSKLLWIAAGAIILLSFGVGIYWKRTQTPTISYRKEIVERGDLKVTILATGVVAPENRVDVKAPIPGRAEQVLVNEGDHVKRGQILLWMSSTERAALLDAARARGAAEFKHWEDYYKPTPVLAPIDGTIILRSVEPGQTFTSADAILGMSDRLTVQAQVDETDLAQVHLKQSAVLVLDAYPDQKIQARVSKIAYDAKTVNNVTTYVVDVSPEQVPDVMRSGMTANVTFVIDTREHVLIVTNDAIKTKNGVSTVLRAASSDNSPPETVEIKTGITDGKRSEIVSGLSEGDVIQVPQFKLNAPPSITNPLSPMSPRRSGGGGGH